MCRIGIILGSTRPNRNGEQVTRWVFDIAAERADAEFELVDLRDYPLPHLDEPNRPSLGQYAHDHTKEWAQKIASFDGFVFVTPRVQPRHLHTLLDQVIASSTALAPLRQTAIAT